MSTDWWLLDGAMLRGSELLRAVSARERSVPLYKDLGAEAGSVGPWLLEGSFQIDVEQVSLPSRLGISRWTTNAGLDELIEHAAAIRHLRSDDGQSFYFRYADTRVLEAAENALPPSMHATIQGPVAQWTWLNRQLQLATFAPRVDAKQPGLRLNLTTKQFESLLAAGLPDRLALMLEELSEEQLGDLQCRETFASICKAADFLAQRHIDSFALQRAVARQAVLTEGAATGSDDFSTAVAGVLDGASSVGEIDAWAPKKAPMIEAIKE